MDKVKPIKVDFTAMGFNLTCAVDFSKAGAGGCSGCGSSGKCS